jgi:hypothetical protein
MPTGTSQTVIIVAVEWLCKKSAREAVGDHVRPCTTPWTRPVSYRVVVADQIRWRMCFLRFLGSVATIVRSFVAKRAVTMALAWKDAESAKTQAASSKVHKNNSFSKNNAHARSCHKTVVITCIISLLYHRSQSQYYILCKYVWIDNFSTCCSICLPPRDKATE